MQQSDLSTDVGEREPDERPVRPVLSEAQQEFAQVVGRILAAQWRKDPPVAAGGQKARHTPACD
jgi:hypothetical protein